MFRSAFTGAVLSALALVLMPPAAFGADGVLLRRAYKPGDKYLAVVSTEQTITNDVSGGKGDEIRQAQRTEMLLEVIAVAPDGTAKARATWQRMAMRIDTPTEKLDYDSGDPKKSKAASPLLTITKALVGKSVIATIGDRGEVASVDGLDPIVAEILSRVPEGPNRDAAKRELVKSLNADSLKQTLGVFGFVLPAEAKAPGDAWNWDQSVSLGRFAEMAVRTTCKVEAVTEKSVEVSMSAGTTLTKVEPGYAVTIDPASRNTGKATIDRANAAVSSGSSQSSTTMTVVSQGRKVTSKTEGKSTVSVTKL